MAGLLHLFDFNQVSMAKKHNNHAGVAGIEAPRNSLDLPSESPQSYYSAEEYEPYSYEGTLGMSKSSSYSTEASMKKLINEKTSKATYYKHTMPSIVARLMGMDVFPSGTESLVENVEKEDDNPIVNDVKRQIMDKVPSTVRSRKKKSSREKKFRFSYKDAHAHLWSSGTKLAKPRPRVHPQEKELQQFKKDFEAWQAVRFLECARVVELSNIPEQWLAQLDLTKEKMVAYETSRKTAFEKAKVIKRGVLKSRSFNGGGLQQGGSEMDPFPAKQKDPISFRKKSMDRDLDQVSMIEFDQNSDESSTPPRIVILKPGPDSNTSNDESWVSSSGPLEDRDNIEDLLEEVTKRLKSELQGKTFRKGSMVRGGGIETPFREKPLYPRQRPQHLTTHVREKLTGGQGRRLLRSESVTSHRSEIHAPEPSSPEFMSGDIRKLLSERLRNVLNGENHHEIHNVSNSSSSPTFSDDTRERLEQAGNILNARIGWNDWNDSKYEADAQARSCRHEFRGEERFRRESSPRKHVRSLSAPISGTSFGKLLLEDRHVRSGVHIRRKHESLESMGADVRAPKKERFNFREKVSNIRRNFNRRGKLFSRNLLSVDLSPRREFDPIKNFMGGPTVALNFNDTNDNSTELPPSPASVCSSSSLEDLWKPLDHSSPISISIITPLGDQSVGNVFREISSNLSALRRQLHQLDEGSEVTTANEEPLEAELVDLEDEGEAYVRDLLVASGLYDGSLEKSFSRWDPFVKHISDSVFEKVEESYRKPSEEIIRGPTKGPCEGRLNRKVLFDLSNEALSRVMGPPMTLSKFRRKVMGDETPVPLPQGRKLLEKVWEIVCYYTCPPPDSPFGSLDDMVAYDPDSTPWFSLMDEEVKFFGRELEGRIIGELILEVVKDIKRCDHELKRQKVAKTTSNDVSWLI